MVEQLNAIARIWWDWTAAMFWQVGLLIVLIACIDRLIRRWAWPQLRYALWSLILIKLLLPPSLSLPSGIVPGLQPKVAQAVRWMGSEKAAAAQNSAAIADFGLQIADLGRDVDGPFAVAVSRSQGARAVEPASPVSASTHDANPQSAIVNPQLEWHVYAMAIWLAGTVILGTWLFVRLHSLAGRHAYVAAAASLPQSFYNQLAGCAKLLRLRHVPRVAVTGRLVTPAVFGVFRPALLMPKGYLSKLSRRDTEHMLLHELAHIRRGDLVLHGLYMLVQIVYWYNPLLWLVRRQLHHLRELSCDATVANLLRERTPAYRQTLLETARRLLARPVEPGLGLLGLFEDSNRLAVRLNWLTKPTWRYRTMKRVAVATVAALMLACVLPMAQAQEPASDEVKQVSPEEDNQLSQDIAALEVRLQELMAQQQELQKQLRALAERRSQVRADRETRREARERPRVRPRGRQVPDSLPVAPPEPPARPGVGEVPPEVWEQVRHAQEQAKQAAKDEDLQQWAAQMRAWAEQWKQSEQMQKWQEDMAKWGEQMGRWGQELARRRTESADASEVSEMPALPPMPVMPAMPAMPHVPAPASDATMRAVPHPVPVPHVTGSGAPDAAMPEVHIPHVEVPHIEIPAVEPPVLPVPGHADNLEEAVHYIEFGPLPGDRFLEVVNHVGSITVRSGDEAEYRIRGRVIGKAETKERAQEIAERLVVTDTGVQADGRERIIVSKPEGLSRGESCNVRLEVTVPREARLKLHQAVGEIHLAGLRGSIEALAQVGSIRATEVSGRVVLATNVGSIDYTAPADLSAKIHAKADLGSIQTDLPLEVTKPRAFAMGSSAFGTIGQGTDDISLSTDTGSIRIRSMREPTRAEPDHAVF